MNQHNIPDGLPHEVYQLFAGGHTSEEIKSRLLKRELDPDMVDEVVKVVRDVRQRRKRNQGLVATAIGSALLLIGFVLSYILSTKGLPTGFALYGLTSLGITSLFTGMVLYFS